MLKPFLFLTFLSCLATYRTQAQPLTPVVISQSDISTLGGWPLDRKFYGLVIETLTASGADEIYFELAFPTPDLLHPESDDYFGELLSSNPSVFILNHLSEAGDSVTVLKQIKLPAYRTFQPLSTLFETGQSGLFVSSENLSLFSGLLPSGFTRPEQIFIPFPSESIQKPISFLDLLTGKTTVSADKVFIYLDLPGVTSYVGNSATNKPAPTGLLYVSTLNAMANGDYKTVLPTGFWLIFFISTLFPAGFFKPGKRTFLPAFTTFLIPLLTGVSLFLTGYFLPNWFYFSFLLPLVLILWSVWLKIQTQIHQPVQTAAPVIQSSDTTQEVSDLKYRLNFYENLSSVIPDSLSNAIVSSEGLIFHTSSPVNELLKKAKKVAETDIPIMLFGESGTGKERLARFIHNQSSRAKKPFIAINCGSFNDNLIESELFGYEKGAFTGALQSKPGRFELADSGTLFLDEIGETSPGFQVKLLRVLQEGVFERVGGVTPIRVSVRVITATHQEINKLIEEKKFREDLFYRLNGFVISIPPLRERPMDIEAIFADFLRQQKPDMKYSEALVAFLCRQEWKGNVRQLLSAAERAVVNAELRNRKFLIPDDFELPDQNHMQTGSADGKALQVLASFRTHQFKHRSFSLVASELGMHRVTVTDYFRGWLIRFYAETGSAKGVYNLFKADRPIEDEENFLARIQDYLDGILEKVDAGLSSGESDTQILQSRFKNLPSQFGSDLIFLIEKRRKDSNR
ncbi:MAG: sigma 54-interacting transcriptional regulator [Bacteroidetes bacterium]|nr:sigma 54-interacting transcriptional regulator [Bacteroidota bacterium]